MTITLRINDETVFHHTRNLAGVRYGVVQANPKYSDPDLLPAYQWLEQQVGFFPLFVAVGDSDEARWDTGYQNQWRVRVDYDFENRRALSIEKRESSPTKYFSLSPI